MIIGIDIGFSGAICFMDYSTMHIGIDDMPVLNDGPAGRKAISPALLATLVGARGPVTHAYVESVGARPGEGAVGAFAFGRSRGVVEGVLGALRIPYSFLTPPQWKRIVGLPPGKDKAASRSLAIRTWPHVAGLFARVKDDGRAEAALIALAGIKHGT